MPNEIRFPYRNVAGDQIVASSQNAAGKEEQHVRLAGGAGPANEAGTISVVGGVVGGTTDYSSVGNVTIAVFGAAHAGFTIVLEASPDAGTTWFSMTAQDEATNTQAREPSIPTNGARLYSLSLFGLNRFRVRASARTSGTLSVVIAPGTALIEPVVAAVLSQPAGAQIASFTATNAVGAVTTTEVLVPMAASRNLAAPGAAVATQTVTAGKTFRPLGWQMSHISGAAVIARCTWSIRAVLTGTAAIGSPVVANAISQNPAATAGSVGSGPFVSSFPELPGGTSFAVSNILHIASAATTSTVSLWGLEY
jgi:hypothetical protein